jgi:hypothetical protein
MWHWKSLYSLSSCGWDDVFEAYMSPVRLLAMHLRPFFRDGNFFVASAIFFVRANVVDAWMYVEYSYLDSD